MSAELDPYSRLARRLSALGMGPPPNDVLLDVLQATLSPAEAEVLLTLPTGVPPLHVTGLDALVLAPSLDRTRPVQAFDRLAARREEGTP